MIYRIAEPADWRAALATGNFASADLAAEGFIHASDRHQILRTAGKYYSGRRDLLLLEIDDRALGSLVVREDLAASGMTFPHIYGPIPMAAIIRHFAFATDDAGVFSLPPGMAG